MRIGGTGQAQFFVASEQAFDNLLEGVQVFTQQKNCLGVHAFNRLEFIGRFTNALRQHAHLGDGLNFFPNDFVLDEQGANGFRKIKQGTRLLIHIAQGLGHFNQHIFLF